MDNVLKKKLLFLLDVIDYQIEQAILNVLLDTEDDPHHSAIWANNIFSCYIDAMNKLGESVPFHNIEEYMKTKWFSDEEIDIFIHKRETEAQYYIGEQF